MRTLPWITLQMSAHVYAPVQLVPSRIAFGDVKPGERRTRTVRLEINDEKVIHGNIITTILNGSKNITVEKGDSPHEMQVEICGSNRMQEEDVMVHIGTTISELPVLELSIRAVHSGVIEADPGIVMLSRTRLSQLVRVSFLQRIQDPQIEFAEPAGGLPFKLTAFQTIDDCIIDLSVSLDPDYKGGPQKAHLRIANNHVSRVIPVYFTGLN